MIILTKVGIVLSSVLLVAVTLGSIPGQAEVVAD